MSSITCTWCFVHNTAHCVCKCISTTACNIPDCATTFFDRKYKISDNLYDYEDVSLDRPSTNNTRSSRNRKRKFTNIPSTSTTKQRQEEDISENQLTTIDSILHNLHIHIPQEPHKTLTSHIQLLQPTTPKTNALFLSTTNTTNRLLRQQIVQQLLHALPQYKVERIFIQQMNETEQFQTYPPPHSRHNIQHNTRSADNTWFPFNNLLGKYPLTTNNLLTHILKPTVSPHSLSTSPTSETQTGNQTDQLNQTQTPSSPSIMETTYTSQSVPQSHKTRTEQYRESLAGLKLRLQELQRSIQLYNT